jgi:large subunit ribosomal protein L15
MKIHELTVESKKDRKRLGRGIGSGTGKTSGRGTKGQNSRSGGGVRIGFEGGQNPLAKRLPKRRGFRSLNPSNYTTVNLSVLESLKGAKITNQTLFDQGIIAHAHDSVKILGTGKLTKKLTVEVQSATATAITAITKVGGTFTTIQPAKTPKKPSKRNRKA